MVTPVFFKDVGSGRGSGEGSGAGGGRDVNRGAERTDAGVKRCLSIGRIRSGARTMGGSNWTKSMTGGSWETRSHSARV